jgi:hypothetical protein
MMAILPVFPAYEMFEEPKTEEATQYCKNFPTTQDTGAEMSASIQLIAA